MPSPVQRNSESRTPDNGSKANDSVVRKQGSSEPAADESTVMQIGSLEKALANYNVDNGT